VDVYEKRLVQGLQALGGDGSIQILEDLKGERHAD